MCTPKMFVPHQFSNDPSLSVEKRADRHVRRLQGFYAHLAAYVVVNALLVGVNLLTSPGVFWAIWPILGWGVKLGAHAMAVFGIPGYDDWKARVRHDYIRRHAGSTFVSSDGPGAEPTEERVERLRRRIEHLETIVTSADWDLLSELEDDPIDEQIATLAEEAVLK